MNIRILAASAVVAALGFASPVSAASPKDVQAVRAMIQDERVPVLMRHHEFIGGEPRVRTIVFVEDTVRYTLYDSGEPTNANDPRSAWLSVWVRQRGVKGLRSVDTFTDFAFDGVVDLGINNSKTQFFRSGADGGKPEGKGNLAHWQKAYDAAIAAALRYRNRVRK